MTECRELDLAIKRAKRAEEREAEQQMLIEDLQRKVEDLERILAEAKNIKKCSCEEG